MECLGVEPGAAWWKAQTNPLSYGGTPIAYSLAKLMTIIHGIAVTRYKSLLTVVAIKRKMHV